MMLPPNLSRPLWRRKARVREGLSPILKGYSLLRNSQAIPVSHATSFAKDDLENYLNRAVCSGRTPLAAAQHAIATDWVGAYCAARLPRCGDGANFK